MIKELDLTLRRVLAGVFSPGQVDEEKWIRFQPPDEKWRQYVSALNHPALNVYLVDLRENRVLRSNQRVRTYAAAGASDQPAAPRMDCHYLVSAWSPMPPVEQFDPTGEVEHELLYRATHALMNAEPLVPAEVFAPGSPPAGFPLEVAKSELPMKVLPTEGFPKYAEFWGTMGGEHPWKPAVYLTVTIPVLRTEQFAGPLVTTVTTGVRQSEAPETAETWIEIGGEFSSAQDGPLPGARIILETEAGVVAGETRTDAAGRFTFPRLATGRYTLRGYAQGYPETAETYDVPSPAGRYDLATG